MMWRPSSPAKAERGHSYPQPAVRFHGEFPEGFRALAVALEHGLPIRALHRCWHVQDGEPVGPDWELTFWRGGYFPCALSVAHASHKRRPPVPFTMLYGSMLSPTVHAPLLW